MHARIAFHLRARAPAGRRVERRREDFKIARVEHDATIRLPRGQLGSVGLARALVRARCGGEAERLQPIDGFVEISYNFV